MGKLEFLVGGRTDDDFQNLDCVYKEIKEGMKVLGNPVTERENWKRDKRSNGGFCYK